MRYDQESLTNNKIPGPETGIEIRKTICSICGMGCGINAYVKDDRVVKVEGIPEFPANRGTLCVKGNANRQYIYNADRIHTPLKRVGKRGQGAFEAITWEQAYEEIAERLLQIKAETGPESVVIVWASPNGCGLLPSGWGSVLEHPISPLNPVPAFLPPAWPPS
jgi:anaerobic selenocysteine-containing dehydrogenase